MIRPARDGYFITGSDTDVGKTFIACQLVEQLRLRGEVETRKPVESGCRPGPDGELETSDAAALREANGQRETIERIAAYRFRAALAPHRAARLENRRLQIGQLIEACRRDSAAARLVVEGAGGFYSPLAEDGLNADLAGALQLPVIIVVDDRIGAVNQALMTVEAVRGRALEVAAIVFNQAGARRTENMDNSADFRDWSDVPVFVCGYRAALPALFRA